MELKSLGAVIKAAVIAGVIAGALVAAFHFVATEPVIERAIDLEKMLSQAAGKAGEEPLVTRDTQRAGLFLGFLIYGLTWALLFSTVYHLVQSRLPAMHALGRGLLLALLTGWSVALFPFLKYPANPPGVGDPETIQQRQTLYLAFVALSVANTLLASALHRYLSQPGHAGRSRARQWTAVLGVYAAGAAALYIAMPANSEAIRMPVDLVWTFRALSLAGLALFWAVLGGSFGWLIRAGKAA